MNVINVILHTVIGRDVSSCKHKNGTGTVAC